MTNWNLRVLSGLLLSLIWVSGNLAFASAESGPPSVLARAAIVSTPTLASSVPPTTRPVSVPTPIELPAEPSGVPTTVPPPPSSGSSERRSLQVPTTTPSTPITRTSAPQKSANSMTGQQYRYFERSLEVTALQIELGMQSVDGVYGPQTRKAHVLSLGGPHTLLLRNYPEFGQVLTPCSHGCIPGDGHYELPTLEELINEYFLPEDRALALMIAFCESSGQTHHVGSDVVSDALAVGWFQHLARYWAERSDKAGWGDYHPFHGRANVAVAAWLYYSSGVHHWNPSQHCWGPSSS